jgi:hypothetical protein
MNTTTNQPRTETDEHGTVFEHLIIRAGRGDKVHNACRITDPGRAPYIMISCGINANQVRSSVSGLPEGTPITCKRCGE